MAAENVKLKTQQCQSLLVPVYNINFKTELRNFSEFYFQKNLVTYTDKNFRLHTATKSTVIKLAILGMDFQVFKVQIWS